MKDKKPIDKKRESGGMADIGTAEDGAIVQMIKIGERLIILKERSIYEIMTADEIDPERTNISIPNEIQKKIIDKGSESEMVSRVFLTANTLLNKGEFEDGIDFAKALALSLDLIQELAVLEDEIENYLTKEKEVSDEYESQRNRTNSYSIPTIGNAKNRCTTIFQKSDHIEQTLMKIITIFYQNEGLTQQSHFPKFYEVIKLKYGEKNGFVEFLNSTLEFMKLIRNLRNALDHQLSAVQIHDFELTSNSNVLAPSIEIDFKGSKLERQSLSDFLNTLIPNLITICELTMVYLVGHNFKSSPVLQDIKEIPKDKRKNKFVRFSFWSSLGVDGFYNQ